MPQLVWLITGCSSGLGYQFVLSVLDRGDLVVATARSLSTVEQLTQRGAHVLQLDVTFPQQEINDAIAKAVSFYGRIDVLLNNAGHVQVGVWEDLEYEDWVRQFEVNVFGPIKVTKAILPHFRDRRHGTMVFVSSINGFIGHPAVGPYSASKHALEGAVESLSKEVAPFGLKTLLIEPGRFRTKLLSVNNLKVKRIKSISPDYNDVYQNLLPDISREDGNQPGDPEKLASIVVDLVHGEGVAAGRHVPLRMFLGNDAWDEVGMKLRTVLKDFEEWEGVTRSTDQSNEG